MQKVQDVMVSDMRTFFEEIVKHGMCGTSVLSFHQGSVRFYGSKWRPWYCISQAMWPFVSN